MIIRLTDAYQNEVARFTAHNQTRLSWKALIREIHETLGAMQPPVLWTMGVIFIDTPFEQAALRSIACLYIRNPEKDNEIAPCLLYFPYDAAELSINKQGMGEQMEAVKQELGW